MAKEEKSREKKMEEGRTYVALLNLRGATRDKYRRRERERGRVTRNKDGGEGGRDGG